VGFPHVRVGHCQTLIRGVAERRRPKEPLIASRGQGFFI